MVGIGASAGGLEACRKLLDALPPSTGMAFILVQHLDPTHESMMVDLLAGHTSLTVLQAADATPLQPGHLYVIPPGSYLSVTKGALHLSSPQARHGTRLPVDFLLQSLATEFGARAVCVILSGSGADGSLGLKAIKEKGGLVIVQSPEEAGHDGMPKSAIMTGAVDLVLPAAGIPEAIVKYRDRMAAPSDYDRAITEILDLLRVKTAHDFTLYKLGTLQRRIERRMAIAAVGAGNIRRYLEILRADGRELTLLAKDLLIHVTSFFRDAKVFSFLGERIVPDLVRQHPPDQPLRIWIAGCSTGEETYSLAMLFQEQIAATKSDIKLQVFASDVDPDAVAKARDAHYPPTIEADVSPARLARFFFKDGPNYRIVPELRSTVVFTVQDVLADPPFSRLDLVSCRNLLIYLRPDAQMKVLSLFHFALRDGGLLLLGNAETAGHLEGRFEIVSKPARLYRRIGRARAGEFAFAVGTRDAARNPLLLGPLPAPPRQAVLADLCRRLVMESHAPATVLINRRFECLYSAGPTDRYLRVPPGQPTHDLFAMARANTRTKLRAAIQQALHAKGRIVVPGGQTSRDGSVVPFSIDIQPVLHEGEDLLLICFVDEPVREEKRGAVASPEEMPRVAELEQELDATRAELLGAIRSLEISSEEQKAINEEALSVNEEFQSTNEELLTSKEELQSLNEELTALNSQLQETAERQRILSNDLQNVLYSTEVATLFLDMKLNIRFFTPATKALFNVIPTDIGRPLSDLKSQVADDELEADARAVLEGHATIERENEAQGGVWFIRRVLPYHTQEGRLEGIVITFTDITLRKQAELAKQEAELANVAKSRFLAAASHDLRQPLQTLSLLQELLAKSIEGKKGQTLVSRLDRTLSAMAGMLNTLLDINQIEAGSVRVETVDFAVNDLLERLKDEFTYHAQAQKLAFRVVPCSQWIHTDPRLLEQMVRNLMSNAFKYTRRGQVLLGCRRRHGMLAIEVWDTGKGIPEEEFEAIFNEYHQLGNPSRERSRGLGLGLGLSIVQQLGTLLDHRVSVCSKPGKGSRFSIEIRPLSSGAPLRPEHGLHPAAANVAGEVRRDGMILVVEDDSDAREYLQLLIEDDGHHAIGASDGPTALELVARGAIRPDLLLADYNLPEGMTGLQLGAKLREHLNPALPVIILTGDISASTLREITAHNCVQLYKPVKAKQLMAVIQQLLLASLPGAPEPAPHPDEAGGLAPSVIFLVDDDNNVRESIRNVLEEEGHTVLDFPACETFIEAYRPGSGACLLIDAYLPGMSGIELLQWLRDAGHRLPAIMITGKSDVPTAVRAMRAGALDFIEKPISRRDLLDSVARAVEQTNDANKQFAWQKTAAHHIASLTRRQRQILDLVLAGHPSKNIAADLGISQRTVENHRASIMKKTGSKSLPALARLALAATAHDTSDPSAKA